MEEQVFQDLQREVVPLALTSKVGRISRIGGKAEFMAGTRLKINRPPFTGDSPSST